MFPGLCDDDGIIGDDDDDTDTPAVEGSFTVSLNPSSPSARTVPNSGLVPFGKFDLKAGSEGAMISSLTLKREGLSNRSDIKRVYLERNGVRVSNRASVTIDDMVLLSFSPLFKLASNEKATLDLIVELDTGAVTGAEHFFSVVGSDVRTATMRLGSYSVEEVTIDKVSSGTSNVNVGDTNVLIGEFKLATTGDKDNVLKTITFRNDGTGDVGASLSNLALYNDGVKVSTDVEMNGRDVTFSANSEIRNGTSENYEIRADITGAERSPETYIFKVRNSTDASVTEKGTGFSAPIVTLTTAHTFTSTDTNLGTVKVEGGDTLLSRDTEFTTSQTVSPNSSDVVLWAAKLNVKEAVELEDVTADINFTAGADLNQVTSLRFIVDGTTVASYSPSATSAIGVQTINFDSQFTVSKNSTMRIVANLRSTANGTVKVNSVDVGSTDARYVSNDEVATIDGAASGINTSIEDATLSITQNDGIDNYTLVSGAKNVTLLGVALRANDVSDVKITGIQPVKTGSVDMANVSNVRLYQGNTLISTKNNFDFNSLNITIPKNTSTSFKIVADFNTSVVSGKTITLTLAGAQINARDVSSNATITATSSAANAFNFVSAGTIDTTVNSSQANASIVTPSTSEASVFKFDVEAKNDTSRVTDIYVTKDDNDLDLASALRSSSLTLGGVTTVGVIIDDNTLHFSFGSQGITVNRDEKLTADLKVAFFDSSKRTNLPFQFKVPTGAVSGQVTGTSNGMRIVSDSTGDTFARAGGVIASKNHLLARSKPTVAASAFTSSVNNLYEFTVTADANRKVTLEDLKLAISGSAVLSGGTITVYRETESAGNIVFETTAAAVNNQTLTAAQTTAANVGVSQVTSITPANVEIGDVFTVAIGADTVSYTATAASVKNVVEGLQPLIDALATVSATEDDTKVVVTTTATNVTLTYTTSTVNGQFATGPGNKDVSGTVKFIVKITGVSAANTDLTREVRVSELTYQDDVDTPENINVSPYNVGVPTVTSTYKY